MVKTKVFAISAKCITLLGLVSILGIQLNLKTPVMFALKRFNGFRKEEMRISLPTIYTRR